MGAYKCASTWIHRVLEDHPQAFVSEPKELEYFSLYADRSREWYLGHFRAGGAKLVRGEVSTTYFDAPEAPRRAAEFDPCLRIVVSLRDPVSRAYSHHLFNLAEGRTPWSLRGFEDALAVRPQYVKRSLYAEDLTRWRSHFPPERILVLLQEEIALDPAAEARRLYDFLGIDAAHRSASLHERANPSHLPRSTLLAGLRHRAAYGVRRLSGAALLARLRNRPWMRSLLAWNEVDLRGLVPPPRPETVAALQETFAEDVERLLPLLGRTELPWPTWRALQGAAVRGDR